MLQRNFKDRNANKPLLLGDSTSKRDAGYSGSMVLNRNKEKSTHWLTTWNNALKPRYATKSRETLGKHKNLFLVVLDNVRFETILLSQFVYIVNIHLTYFAAYASLNGYNKEVLFGPAEIVFTFKNIHQPLRNFNNHLNSFFCFAQVFVAPF
jgi:hypothetical protein